MVSCCEDYCFCETSNVDQMSRMALSVPTRKLKAHYYVASTRSFCLKNW